jgi:hypothetical protein
MDLQEIEQRSKEFSAILAARKVIYNRHYKDKIFLLERKFPSKTNAENYKDSNHKDYNVLLHNANITFGMLSDTEFLLSLCINQKEQAQFKNDIVLLKHYQDQIDNFGKTNIEVKETSFVNTDITE